MSNKTASFETGLVSITFRQLAVERIIQLVSEAGLQSIEWGGDIHVPHGDTARAKIVGEATRAAGLRTAAYGSYYKVGALAPFKGPVFEEVLSSAVALGAPLIRVWAGPTGSREATEADRARVAEDTRRICDLAQSAGIRIAYEYHGGTLTDTNDSALDLLHDVAHPNLRALWQPRSAGDIDGNCAELTALLPWLANIHVFHWPAHRRAPLSEGAGSWKEYLSLLKSHDKSPSLLLEFVDGDRTEQFLEDAKTLRNLAGAPEKPSSR